VTSSWGGIRYTPSAFTEQGVAMLSSVEAGLREPTFKPNGFFRAIFHRSSELARKKAPGDSSEKSSEKILALLRERNAASAREIAKG